MENKCQILMLRLIKLGTLYTKSAWCEMIEHVYAKCPIVIVAEKKLVVMTQVFVTSVL